MYGVLLSLEVAHLYDVSTMDSVYVHKILKFKLS